MQEIGYGKKKHAIFKSGNYCFVILLTEAKRLQTLYCILVNSNSGCKRKF